MSLRAKLITGSDNKARCWWCGDDPLYVRYHDTEWGLPENNDVRLFEKICLEGFQAGLAWITVLRKRDDFRKAFADFDFHKVARFGSARVERLVNNAKIIRHRGKIESTISNARQAIKLCDEFGSLGAFFWQFAPQSPGTFDPARSITAESTALSKELRRRGWSFVGPTTCYAFMQAMGLVNDHLPDCFVYASVAAQQARFVRPRSS